MQINWEKYGIDIRKARGGKMFCPKCHDSRKHKRDPSLSVDKETGLFNCHNCGWKGCAKEDEILDRQRPKKEYSKPVPKLQKVSDPILQWFVGRGISNNTLLSMKITESNEWMPIGEDGKIAKVICFNYFRDEELINIKFRSKEKAFRMEKGAELIFYNLNCLREKRPFVIITEGEIDALTFVECGYYGVLSVPNGASRGNQKLEYLDNCWQYFEGIEKILIAVDSDDAGEMLKQELIRRLGAERCWTVTYPSGCKDANEVLLAHGKEGVEALIKSAKDVPIEGVIQLIDVKDDARRMYDSGYPETLKIGWKLDSHIKWRPGEFTVVTGIPNHGKSTWLNNVLVELAKQHDWLIAIFSPEKNPITFLIAELAQIFIGRPYYRTDPHEKMSRSEWEEAMRFIDDHFLFLKTQDVDLTLDGILEVGAKLVKRYGINGLVIDPWNYVETDRPQWQTETEYTGVQHTKVSNFTKMQNVALIVVAHPTKMEKDRKTHKYMVPGLYNISGSAHWNNKPDNGICIYRNYDKGTTEVHIQKIRWFFVGKVGKVEMSFDPACQRFYDVVPELSPEQSSYEEKKANKALTERGREMAFPPVSKDDLPF